MAVNRTRSGDATLRLPETSRRRESRALASGAERRPVVSNYRRAFDAFLRNGPAQFGVLIVLLSILAAIFAPVLARYDPGEFDFANINQWPSDAHWFGTDGSGGDIFSQMVFSLRTSYTVALIAQSIYLVLGMTVGLTAGYFGGWVDSILSRLIDVLFSIPSILIAVLIAGTFGVAMYELLGPAGRLYLTIAALALLSWVGLARVVRSQVFSLRETAYVDAARVAGGSDWWILRRHLMPNLLGTAIVLVSLGFGGAMTLEAVLSYIGLGVTAPTPSLGRLLQQGQVYIDPNWYQFVLPASVLAILVLAFAFIGDGLRDALDPRMHER
jgi:ABC-type dipeptide/oligopeptide/nickel transport system permease subunit